MSSSSQYSEPWLNPGTHTPIIFLVFTLVNINTKYDRIAKWEICKMIGDNKKITVRATSSILEYAVGSWWPIAVKTRRRLERFHTKLRPYIVVSVKAWIQNNNHFLISKQEQTHSVCLVLTKLCWKCQATLSNIMRIAHQHGINAYHLRSCWRQPSKSCVRYGPLCRISWSPRPTRPLHQDIRSLASSDHTGRPATWQELVTGGLKCVILIYEVHCFVYAFKHMVG